MLKRARAKRPKPVTYTLISQTSDDGAPMYEQLYAIVDEHHPELSRTHVRIALAWCTSWKPDVDGRITLGKCKKATDLDRELAPFDFVILLSRDFWENPRVIDAQRRALLDHELMHAAITYDENGDAKVDARGRTVYRIRKHDLEEFTDIVARHGCYKRDIEAFMEALTRAERGSSGWVGYSGLHETLKAIGVDVPTTVIASWEEGERREVLTWALLRRDAGERRSSVTLSPSAPSCLTAALATTPQLVVQ
jgi:hypothetical protein